jgi:hypothetical protein
VIVAAAVAYAYSTGFLRLSGGRFSSLAGIKLHFFKVSEAFGLV